jgi:hypothetical protein
MAKQCGPIFLECTWDNITFYKMDGKYYARKKSNLSREKVLKHKAFASTRFYAGLLVTASKIASSIYSDLPIHWRQFWMFRAFTGEGQVMLEGGATPQEVYDHLWHTYVEYWVIYQHATGIPLKTGRTAKKSKPRIQKTRIKHRIGEGDNKCRRYRRLLSKNHWKSSYDRTAELREQEKKRLEREKNKKWVEAQLTKALQPLALYEEGSQETMQSIDSLLAPEHQREAPAVQPLKLVTCN